jgi:hypothetical protein
MACLFIESATGDNTAILPAPHFMMWITLAYRHSYLLNIS